MVYEHFSRVRVDRFLRCELPRNENRDVVRHLMRQCSRCSDVVEEVTRGPWVGFLMDGLKDRSDPDLYDEAMEEILRLLDRKDVPVPPGGTTGRA